MAIVRVLGDLTGELMTAREVATSLDLSQQYVNKLVALDQLKPVLEIEDYGRVQMRIFDKADIAAYKKKRERSRKPGTTQEVEGLNERI